MLKIFFQNIRTMVVGLCGFLICSSPLECSLEIPFLDCCDFTQNYASKYISLSHTEGKGLGYSQGYSSLDIFLAQPLCNGEFIPFVDLRGHVFNNGRYAANAGLGLRWLNACYGQVWGINGYYDTFLNARLPYHQVSFGLEALTDTWEAHINGYLPIGRKKTPIYTLSYDFSSGFLAKAREQFAMGGFDAEVGYHFCTIPCLDLYTGLGPYYYQGRSQKTKNAFRAKRKHFAGGRLRASAAFMNYLELEGTAAYDSRFKWTGQVTLALNIPLDGIFCFWGQTEDCVTWMLEERLYQPVVRNDMMVIDRINRFSSNPAILDPEFEP